MSELNERREAALAAAMELEASGAPRFLWWLSFCDPLIAAGIPEEEQVPGGPSFLGVVIAEGASEIGALAWCSALGLNPGGEVCLEGPYPIDAIDQKWRHRLLTAWDVEEMLQETERRVNERDA